MGTVEEKIFSTSFPQLHSVFNVYWKPFLNLRSIKWLKPCLSLVIRQIRLGLWQLETEFGDGRMNLLLKTEKLSNFLRWGSRLFHSIMVDGRKEFLKKLRFLLRRGMLCIFRVEYNECLVGIKLNRYLGLWLYKTLWKRQSFLHQRRSWIDPNSNSW